MVTFGNLIAFSLLIRCFQQHILPYTSTIAKLFLGIKKRKTT